MNRFLLACSLFVLSGWGTAFGMDLMQVYQQALQNDPQLRAARAARDSVREARPLALARLLPTLSTGASLNRTHQDRKNGNNNDTYGSSALSLNLSQPIYHRDYWIQLQQSDLQIAEAEARYAAVEQDLVIRVAQAYFDVLSAQDTLEFSRAEKAAIGRQLDQARQRFEVGLIAITAVHEAQAAYDQARADEILADNGLGNAWEALREIISDSEQLLAPLAPGLPLNAPDPADIDQWSEAAFEQNLDLIALRNAVEVTRENIEVQRSGHYPTVDLVGSHGINRTGASTGVDTDASTIGLQLNLPLYQGGGVDSQVRQARYDFENALENLDRERRAVDRQVRDAYRGAVSSMSGVEALEAATLSAESALQATEAGFEVGTRTMVDVLNAQRDLYRARRDLSRVRYGYILNGLRLKKAAGSLSQTDLEVVTSWLE